MNTYPLLLILHLLAAFVFVGTVVFEVLFLEPVQRRLPPEVRKVLGVRLGPRVRATVPWAVLVLYLAGLGLAWQYRGVLAQPAGSPLGILLSIKIALAVSVALHVITALVLTRKPPLPTARARWTRRRICACNRPKSSSKRWACRWTSWPRILAWCCCRRCCPWRTA